MTNWMAGPFRRRRMAARKHKMEAKPKMGVTPRVTPRAMVSATFSGVMPWRSKLRTGWIILCAKVVAGWGILFGLPSTCTASPLVLL